MSLKLTSIRPVVCGFPSMIRAHAMGDQLYNHFKNTPTEYHAVFSHPSKWFSTGIITENTLRRIVSDFPKVVDMTQDYFLEFVIQKTMWDILPTTFPVSNWRIIYSTRYSGDNNNKSRIEFTKRWIQNFDDSIQSRLYDEFKIYWNMNKSGVNMKQNKYILSIMEAFGFNEFDCKIIFPLMDPYPLDFQSMIDELATTPPLSPSTDEEMELVFPSDVKCELKVKDKLKTISLLDLFVIDIANQSVSSDSDLSGYKSDSKYSSD